MAPVWHRHDERLHLHTNKGASRLRHRPMPRSYPRYPSRDEVADYLADYAEKEGLDIRLDTEVVLCAPADGGWLVATLVELANLRGVLCRSRGESAAARE